MLVSTLPVRIEMSICLMILGKKDHVVDASRIYATFLKIIIIMMTPKLPDSNKLPHQNILLQNP